MALFTINVEVSGRVDHYFHNPEGESPDSVLAAIANLKETVMTQQTESAELLNAQADKLDALTGQLGKVATEVQGLKDALAAAGGNVDPALAAAIARVVGAVGTAATSVQTVDDLNPDAPAPAPAPEPAPAPADPADPADPALP